MYNLFDVLSTLWNHADTELTMFVKVSFTPPPPPSSIFFFFLMCFKFLGAFSNKTFTDSERIVKRVLDLWVYIDLLISTKLEPNQDKLIFKKPLLYHK